MPALAEAMARKRNRRAGNLGSIQSALSKQALQAPARDPWTFAGKLASALAARSVQNKMDEQQAMQTEQANTGLSNILAGLSPGADGAAPDIGALLSQNVGALNHPGLANALAIRKQFAPEGPAERATLKDVAGRHRYQDTGELVFPDAEVPVDRAPGAVGEFQAAQAAGLIDPGMTLNDYLASKRARTTVSVNNIRIPEGYMVDPNDDSGAKLIPIPGGPADKFSDSQGKAAAFADRVTQSESVFGTTDAEGNPLDMQGTSLVGGVLGAIPGGNLAQSPEYQQFDQAKRDFINAVLRRESGAAISASEFDNAEKQYFPQPGDTQEVIAQKRANRAAVLQGLTRDAGPRYRDELARREREEATPPVDPNLTGGVPIPTPEVTEQALAPIEVAQRSPQTGGSLIGSAQAATPAESVAEMPKDMASWTPWVQQLDAQTFTDVVRNVVANPGQYSDEQIFGFETEWKRRYGE